MEPKFLTQKLFASVLEYFLAENLYSFEINESKDAIFAFSKKNQEKIGVITFFNANKQWAFEPDLFMDESGYESKSVFTDMSQIVNSLNSK